MRKLITVLLCAVLLSVFSGCKSGNTKGPDSKPAPTPTTEEQIRQLADEVIQALKNKDINSLAGSVHPQSGVRFSPYSYVDTTNHQVFSSLKLIQLNQNSKTYDWGKFEGSGELIQMTFDEYFDKFVYDKDFAAAPKIAYDKEIGHSNTKNNLKEAYPASHSMEYHFPEFDKQYKGQDWESLRLVFQEFDKHWYLTGIIHAQWTP